MGKNDFNILKKPIIMLRAALWKKLWACKSDEQMTIQKQSKKYIHVFHARRIDREKNEFFGGYS